MLTKHLTPQNGAPCHMTAYRPNPRPSLAPPALVALATATLAYTGGLSPWAVAGLAVAGGLAGLSLSLVFWAQAWCRLTEEGWVVE